LPQQVGKRELRVLATARIGQMLLDQFSRPESLVELAHQDQAAVEVTREPWKSILREALKES
jgi:hypothetical protein